MEIRPIKVKAVSQYLIWICFNDNTEGNVDLSHLANKPVFKKWSNPTFFNSVHIDLETDAIAWDENIEICPDSLYMRIKELSFDKFKEINYASN